MLIIIIYSLCDNNEFQIQLSKLNGPQEFADALNNFYCTLLFIMFYSSYVKVSFGFVFFFKISFKKICGEVCYEGSAWLYNDKSSFTDIGGDGNCFFRCLSLHLYRDQKYFGNIRKEVVEYMSNDEKQTKAEKEKRYRQLIETQDEYDDYVK